jgi:hypothetical protein
MTLGRTSSNAIKIKTDSPGLRAVECGCCGASCQPFQISVLGFSFVIEGVLFTPANTGEEPYCEYFAVREAGNYTSWLEGIDYYCDGGDVHGVGGYSGGQIGIRFFRMLLSNTLTGFQIDYIKLISANGENCIYRAPFFGCEPDLGRIADWEVQQAPTGEFTVPVPTASVTYQMLGTITTSHDVCNDYEASTTETSDTSISFTISPA